MAPASARAVPRQPVRQNVPYCAGGFANSMVDAGVPTGRRSPSGPAQERGPASATKHAPQPCCQRDAHFPGRLLHPDPGLSIMKTLDEALTSIAGVPESQLSRHVAAGLPDSAPGPPWDCRVSSVFWSHKAKPGAAEALPQMLRAWPRVAVTIGALIGYIDSPVGRTGRSSRRRRSSGGPSPRPMWRSSQLTVKRVWSEVARTGRSPRCWPGSEGPSVCRERQP